MFQTAALFKHLFLGVIFILRINAQMYYWLGCENANCQHCIDTTLPSDHFVDFVDTYDSERLSYSISLKIEFSTP
jgi:hypothetical protein